MKHAQRTLLSLITAAAMGCAGTLDDDYYGSYQGAGLPVAQTPDAGAARSAARDAGPVWRDARAHAIDDEADAATEAPRRDSGSMASMPYAAGSSSQVAPDAGPPPHAADSGSPAAPDAGAACDFRGLIQMKCASPSCHGAPASTSGLDLTSASLATRVAGRKGIGSCQDELLIDKGNPAQSALYLRVSSVTCGVKMPLGGTLTPNEQACVLSWIESL
jgi:hypothetical protein